MSLLIMARITPPYCSSTGVESTSGRSAGYLGNMPPLRGKWCQIYQLSDGFPQPADFETRNLKSFLVPTARSLHAAKKLAVQSFIPLPQKDGW